MSGMLLKNIIFKQTPSVDAWFQLISKQLLQVSPPYPVRGWTNPFEKYACSSEWIIISPILQGEYLINHHLEMLHSFFGWFVLSNLWISHWMTSPWICSYVWGFFQENFYDLYFRLSCDIYIYTYIYIYGSSSGFQPLFSVSQPPPKKSTISKTSNHLQPPLVPRRTATGYPQGTPVFGGHPLPAMLKKLSQATLGPEVWATPPWKNEPWR